MSIDDGTPCTVATEYSKEYCFQHSRYNCPGSKETGIAVIREADREIHTLQFFDLIHQGQVIRKKIVQQARCRRRSANLPYRAPRFDNRRRREGWLAPDIRHRIDSTMSFVKKKLFSYRTRKNPPSGQASLRSGLRKSRSRPAP